MLVEMTAFPAVYFGRTEPSTGDEPVNRKPRRPTAGKTISLVLLDDNRLLRDGIAEMIRSQPGFKVLAASADPEEALSTAREAKPDIILLDFGLENHDSLALTRQAHGDIPGARIIVMGLLPTHKDVADYVQAGASGFVMKDASFDEFFATIRAVANGAQVLPLQLTRSLFTQIVTNAIRKPDVLAAALHLTTRERQVMNLIGDGLSNKEIAAQLHIAVHTVKSHVHNVLEKLALRTRLEVAAFTHRMKGDGG